MSGKKMETAVAIIQKKKRGRKSWFVRFRIEKEN